MCWSWYCFDASSSTFTANEYQFQIVVIDLLDY